MNLRLCHRWCAMIAALAACAALLQGQALEHRPAPQSPAPQQPVATAFPAGTSLQVEAVGNTPMKAGVPIEARLVYALYLNGKETIAAGTLVRGAVVSLRTDNATRWHGRLRGDFTPFHIAEVQFNEIELPAGPMALRTQGTTTGAPIVRLAAAGVPRQSLIHRMWDQQISDVRGRVEFFTAPGRGDRALQMLYHQLPYHPERIPAHTAWTLELAEPLDAPAPIESPAQPAPKTAPGTLEIWRVHALLKVGVTSATAKPGDPVQALVVEPVYAQNGDLVVPQGSTLDGRVTVAKHARALGRNGKLRFNFQQVRFPEGAGAPEPARGVEGSLAGATAGASQALSMDAEGTVAPKSQASAIAPLFLTLLAGRALDSDGGLYQNNTVASNGFGLIGRVVGIAAGNRNLAAGLGFYAAALSTYDNFLRRGHDVDFPKNTRIEIETTPLRAPVLKPENK